MKSIYTLAAALLIGGLLPSHEVHAQSLNDEADAILAEHFDGEGPGAAVAILQNGEILAETAIGYADVDAEREIDSDTLFDLASVSKHFTAFAILALARDSALDVNQPVQRYVPELALEGEERAITVSDLVHHVSGLPDYSSDTWDGTDQEFARLTTETHLDWLNTQEMVAEPGTDYVYNNSGYVLLSLVVERVSGQSFAEFASARLFRPAGMRSTRVFDRLDLHFPGTATGYKSNEDGSYELSSSPSQVTGDGNVFSNLTDLIAWMRALDDRTILEAAQKKTAWRTGTFDSGEPIADSDGSGYGYGWVIEGDGRVSHSGSWMGTATYVLRDAPSGVSVIVLSNDEEADVADIAEALRALTDE